MVLAFFVYLISSYFSSETKTPIPNITPSPTQSASSPSQFTKVTRVIDGDTIEIENKEKVRYIGIDTPETKHPQKGVECFGKEASEKNKKLVEGKEVKLEKDVSETDKYGRLLRYVFIKQEATSTPLFVNEYLVAEGYASAATFPPDVRYQDLFIKAQQKAQQENKGLWSKCWSGSN